MHEHVEVRPPKVTIAEQWCDRYGVDVTAGGVAILYKATDQDFKTGHAHIRAGFSWQPGTQPEAPDWDGGEKECGGGLHFSPSPVVALSFASGSRRGTRFVACPVRLEDIVVHPDAIYPNKVKAPRVCGPVYEVDIDGKPIEPEAEKAA